MASAIDIGDEFNIHPPNKQEVGFRLYQAAKEKVYHQNMIGSGPLYKTSILQGNQVSISFTYAENGLVNKGNSLSNSFALSDSSGKWFWADAIIDGKTILLSSKEVSRPIKVQYAWQSNPIATMYNAEGLPMVPFNEKINQ
jgi:sialate O-acetylesterase